MRMVRPAVALGIMFLSGNPGAPAADLLAADRPIGEAIDHYLDQALAKERAKPAPAADDATIVRRLMLDLVGRIPTAAEAQAYIESTAPDKQLRLIDRLLTTPGFVRHQATELDTMLTAGEKGSLREYLVKAVGENASWDRIFRELMLPDQTDKARKAAAEYLRARVKDSDRLTVDVSSTFFGVNISCAQCHDHPLVTDWKQDHFYGMKSFFDRTFVNGRGDAGFLGEHGYGSVKFKTTEGVERQAKLMFLSGRKVDEPDDQASKDDQHKKEKEELERALKAKAPPPAPKFSARAKLVELALQPGDRDFFARSIVNRLWNRVYGRGLVMPLDQMHSANPPSHPELLAWLARDTIDHGYDLRRLTRGLVSSRAYARDSRSSDDQTPRPSLFGVAVVRPLTPMQLACSLRVATADPAGLGTQLKAAELDKRIAEIESSAKSLADALGFARGDAQIGVAEALFFSNGKRVVDDLLADGDGRLFLRLKQTAAPAEQIDLAVRNVLSRPPDDEDRRVLGEYLADRTDRPDQACRQLLWALLTSAEFRFNH
jgi:Protein of unknown function (DUF1549)/Protein of unknown function (DUF1553)